MADVYVHIEQYLTFWAILLSYIIFFLVLVFRDKIPLWLFLSGCCTLTAITVSGTIFSSLTLLENDVPMPKKENGICLAGPGKDKDY